MIVLLRLALWQLRNTLRDALTNPRKLIPLVLVALATAGFVYIITHPPAGTPPPASLLGAPPAHRAETDVGLFLILSLIMAALLDRGFAGGTLTYSASDTDYLFLAPFPSRYILGYKQLAPAPGILLAVLYNFLHPAGPGLSALPPWVPVAAFFACTGGYQNIAVSLDLVYGLGRSVPLRRAYLGAMTLLVAYVIYLSRRHGLAGLAGAAEHGLLPFLFYPCRLTADVALATSAAKGWLAGGQLLFFYLLTLALAFVPNVNFHEAAAGATERAARAQQALAAGQWWFRTTTSKRPRAPMSLPPLGRLGRRLGAPLGSGQEPVRQSGRASFGRGPRRRRRPARHDRRRLDRNVLLSYGDDGRRRPLLLPACPATRASDPAIASARRPRRSGRGPAARPACLTLLPDLRAAPAGLRRLVPPARRGHRSLPAPCISVPQPATIHHRPFLSEPGGQTPGRDRPGRAAPAGVPADAGSGSVSGGSPDLGGFAHPGVSGLRRRMRPDKPAAVARGDARLPCVSA